MAGSSLPASRRWFWHRSWSCVPARPRARPRTCRCRRYTPRRRRRARFPPVATRIPGCRAGVARSPRPGSRAGCAVMASGSTTSCGRLRALRPTTRGPPSFAAPTATTHPGTDPGVARAALAGAVTAITHSPDARTHHGSHAARRRHGHAVGGRSATPQGTIDDIPPAQLPVCVQLYIGACFARLPSGLVAIPAAHPQGHRGARRRAWSGQERR